MNQMNLFIIFHLLIPLVNRKISCLIVIFTKPTINQKENLIKLFKLGLVQFGWLTRSFVNCHLLLYRISN